VGDAEAILCSVSSIPTCGAELAETWLRAWAIVPAGNISAGRAFTSVVMDRAAALAGVESLRFADEPFFCPALALPAPASCTFRIHVTGCDLRSGAVRAVADTLDCDSAL